MIQGWLQDAGLDVERRSNNVLARGPRRQKPLVLLVGHSDTVPPSPQDRGVHREGGRLYARGAADMKSGLAVMVGLARDLDLAGLAYDVAHLLGGQINFNDDSIEQPALEFTLPMQGASNRN